MKRHFITMFLGVCIFSLFSWAPALHAAGANEDAANPSADQTQTSADTRTNESEKANKNGVPPDWVARAARERALGWPRSIENEEGTFTIYQPQIKQWDYNVIEYGMAVEVVPQDKDEPVYGAVELKGITDTDFDERLVQIRNTEIGTIKFPEGDPQNIGKLRKSITDLLKTYPMVVPLDQVLADVSSNPEAVSVKSVKVGKQVPEIIVRQGPAVLLIVDGDPLLQPLADTGLQVVINANGALFRDPESGIYYLFTGEQWLSTLDLDGTWKKNPDLPAGFANIPDDHQYASIKDLLKITSEKDIEVIRAQAPAELLLIDGPPKTAPIMGTGLLYVTNTDQHLFFHNAERLYYHMSSGRWFRSETFNGPWVAVNDDLPEDFRRIPAYHFEAAVLTAVPGTQQAEQGGIEAQIPRKITVLRDRATLHVEYHGDPVFERIQDTTVEYAVNTTYDVIKTGKKYYCCFQAVWFVAKKPMGPWEVCDSVPGAIYSIPPSHAKHHVVYVRVYESTPETVTFGYTGGYTGIYVSDGAVVEGTGYEYPTKVHHYSGRPYYYAYPSFSFYFGFGYPYWWWQPPYYYYPRPCHYGRWRYHNRRYAHHYSYKYSKHAAGYGRGSHRGAGFEAGLLRGPYNHWGKSVARRSSDWAGTWHSSRTSPQGSRTAKGFSGWNGPRTNARNNLYAGKDGNVYRHDVNGWSRRENTNWNRVDTGQSPTSRHRGSDTYSGLQRARSSRSLGSYASGSPRPTGSHRGARASGRGGSYSRPGSSHPGSRGSYSRGSGGSRSFGGRGGFR